MTDSSIGIRGVTPFAGTSQRRRQPQDREGERSLAKHVDASDGDNDSEATQDSLSLDPGRLIDIKV